MITAAVAIPCRDVPAILDVPIIVSQIRSRVVYVIEFRHANVTEMFVYVFRTFLKMETLHTCMAIALLKLLPESVVYVGQDALAMCIIPVNAITVVHVIHKKGVLATIGVHVM